MPPPLAYTRRPNVLGARGIFRLNEMRVNWNLLTSCLALIFVNLPLKKANSPSSVLLLALPLDGKQCDLVDERNDKEQAVQPIQHSSVSWHQFAAVFCAHLPF